MLAMAIGWIVTHIMTNFLYTFGGEDLKQMYGGPTGDEITQAVSRHLGNEYDERFIEKCESLDIKLEVYDRYADDQDIALRNFGRTVKFCPLAGEMVEKTEIEVAEEVDTTDDVLVMEELRKVAVTVIEMFKTEADSPGNHPELGHKVPILDLAVWIEKTELSSSGMDSQDLHNSCGDKQSCLPIGAPRDQTNSQGMAREANPAKRMVQQVFLPWLLPARQSHGLQPTPFIHSFTN